MAGIQNLGQINDIVTRTSGGIVHQKSQNLWVGDISPAARADTDPSLASRIADALQPDRLEHYFVAANMDSPTRCIDGRITKNYQPDIQRPLGPQVPGGTAISALTRRILHAEPLTSAISFTEDLKTVINILQQKGLAFGGHIDTADHVHGNTGCGAIDKVPEVLACIANPRAQRQVRGLAQTLLGERYDDSAVDAIIGRIINLESIAEQYFLVDETTGVLAYKQLLIDEMCRDDSKRVASLTGPHYEVGLVVNTLPGTTFDGDKFSLDNNNQVQLFNYDFWFSLYVADKLYPIAQDVSYQDAKKNLRLQHEYILCRTLLAIAVAMVLTDGTIKLIVRQ